MSSLTTETKIVYCAVYYIENSTGSVKYDNESINYGREEEAINAANMYLSMMNESIIGSIYDHHYFAKIEKRIVPIYK